MWKNERENVPHQWLRKLKEHFDEQTILGCRFSFMSPSD